MSSIVYYITGHGYGHAVRANQVIRSLLEANPDLTVHAKTSAPEWLFGSPGRLVYYRQAIDVGMVQRDSLEIDLAGTLRACRKLHDNLNSLVEQEIEFIERNRICLVVGDIPPACFEIAARANIPAFAITNFAWSTIYRAYSQEYPGFEQLIEQIEAFYAKATLALTLPYDCGLEVFPRRVPIPWIARTSRLTKYQARKKFALPGSATIVLLSFGGLGVERLPWNRLKELRDFYFVATGPARGQGANVLIVPNGRGEYQDLIRAVDLVVTKPGYGIVADVLAHKVPILYTERGEFPEYFFLVRALHDLTTAEFIPQDALLSGDIAPDLYRLLAREVHWPDVPLHGAEVAADKITACLTD